jgi:hypothetical protein
MRAGRISEEQSEEIEKAVQYDSLLALPHHAASNSFAYSLAAFLRRAPMRRSPLAMASLACRTISALSS